MWGPLAAEILRLRSRWLPFVCSLVSSDADPAAPARVCAEIATRTGVPVPRPERQTVLLVERKNHVNRRVDFHRLAIQKRGLIAPLTNRIQRRLLQERVARHDFELLNRAVLADDGMQA